MSRPELGLWDPLDLVGAAAIFDGAPFRWWISGGRALELHLGRSWREHDDTDVGLTRESVPQLLSVLVGWDIHVAAAGQLSRWDGQSVRADLEQNNLWCRRDPNSPWALDVTVGEGDGDDWVYRRDARIRFPWSGAVLRSADDIPYLAPELQLLFKSKDVRDKDDVDARQVIPELEPARRDRLAELLPDDHPWQRVISAHQ